MYGSRVRWAKAPPSDITGLNFAKRKLHKNNLTLKTNVDDKPTSCDRCDKKQIECNN